MDGLIILLALSFAMFFGSYFAGSIPLAMSFSESKLRFVSIFGAGLLVGTALAVIIPEGVQSLYEAESEAHNREYHMVAEQILAESDHRPPQQQPRLVPEAARQDQQPQKSINDIKNSIVESVKKSNWAEVASNRVKRAAAGRKLMQAYDAPAKDPVGPVQDIGQQQPKAKPVHLSHDAHNSIGPSLVAGFVFMLIIDQITRSQVSRGEAANNLSRSRYKITATVGLVVHAAADGIALGAASSTRHSEIQFIVFVAIMLHKAPAAFGLVTFLLVEGLEKSRIRRHLLIFALSAPFTAVFTFVVITMGGKDGTLTSASTTGLLMLFSAGTFLYVATVHVLPEMVNNNNNNSNSGSRATVSKGYSNVPLLDTTSLQMTSTTTNGAGPVHVLHSHGGAAFGLQELGALIVGAALPVFLSASHAH